MNVGYAESFNLFRKAMKDETDPVEIGIKIHVLLMSKVAETASTQEGVLAIAQMIDCLVGSGQVYVVEHGLGYPAEKFREKILENLKKLGIVNP